MIVILFHRKRSVQGSSWFGSGFRCLPKECLEKLIGVNSMKGLCICCSVWAKPWKSYKAGTPKTEVKQLQRYLVLFLT